MTSKPKLKIKTVIEKPTFTRGGPERTAASFKAPPGAANDPPAEAAPEAPGQALATAPSYTAPAVYEDEPFTPAPPGTDLEGDFIGERMTLDWVTGLYVLARLGTSIQPGTLRALVRAIAWSWVHFENGLVVGRIPYVQGQPFQTRAELDPPPPPPGSTDLDSWKLTAYLYLQALQAVNGGTDFTFYGAGKYARGAVSGLQKTIADKRLQFSGAVPLILLDRREIKPKGGKRGGWAPYFTLLKWRLADGSEIPA